MCISFNLVVNGKNNTLENFTRHIYSMYICPKHDGQNFVASRVHVVFFSQFYTLIGVTIYVT